MKFFPLIIQQYFGKLVTFGCILYRRKKGQVYRFLYLKQKTNKKTGVMMGNFTPPSQ